MSEEPRSRTARARAETALVRLLHELREDEPFLIVLGGLVPDVLTRNLTGAVPEHLGTTDVDVLLITHVEPDRDLGAVEQALERLDFDPDPNQDGWRWRGLIDDSPVLIEFLCDLPERYRGPSDAGPRAYAEAAAQVNPATDEAELRADAVDVVHRFFDAMDL